MPVVLENDATAATHAEATYGAARGADLAVVVTLGTGIGGGIVLGGRLHRGHNGMAGEFGHMQVAPGGLPCECGGRGCWEQYSSGNALVRYAREQLGTRPTMLEEQCTGNPQLLTGLMVTAAAEAGDLLAHEAFTHVGDWLGVGLANLVAAFDPDCLVVGGGVSAAGDRLLEPARTALQRTLVGAAHRVVPPVLPATLGPEAGLIGAADLARGEGPASAGRDLSRAITEKVPILATRTAVATPTAPWSRRRVARTAVTTSWTQAATASPTSRPLATRFADRVTRTRELACAENNRTTTGVGARCDP